MRFRCRELRLAWLALLTLAMCIGCEREQRRLVQPPSGPPAQSGPVLSDIRPGNGTPRPASQHPYELNAYEISQGQRLYEWFNCSGCHAHGGGAIGPPLMDEEWIYGSSPENIRASIAQGRPNGMPAFGARVPEREQWQLTAYVRSMAGFVSRSASPSRPDAMHVKPSEQTPPRAEPKPGGTPPDR